MSCFSELDVHYLKANSTPKILLCEIVQVVNRAILLELLNIEEHLLVCLFFVVVIEGIIRKVAVLVIP